MAPCWKSGDAPRARRGDRRRTNDAAVNMRRIVTAEILDHLAPASPAAQRSRRDLRRVHHAMRTRSIVAGGWRALWPAPDVARRLKILELGAGDGILLLGVARALAPAWPPVDLTLLDRQDLVTPTTLAAFAALGWNVELEVADVLDWAAQNRGAMTPPAWDLITTALFLHHFEAAPLDELLVAIAASTDRFFACEPRRGWLALAASHLVGAIGANQVTRVDAVSSVHAGFRGHEITRLWSGAAGAWHSREHAAGPFSHCFSAWRRRAG